MRKQLLLLIMATLAPMLCLAGSNDDGPIEIDWYPLFTDSVGWNIYSGGFVIGLNGAQDLDVDMAHSFELGWLNVIGMKYNFGHGSRLTAGVGIDWRNYRLHDTNFFVAEDGDVQVSQYDSSADYHKLKSRLKVFSLTLPIIFRQRLFDRVDVFGGGIINYNAHASILTRYSTDGNKYKFSSNNVNQVPVTIDFMAGVKWSCLGAYFRYSPCHVLKESHAPVFNPFSTGIFLGF